MRKVMSLFLVPAMIVLTLAGCGGNSSGGSNFTSSYAGCWQGTWTQTEGYGILNITVAGDGSWTGVLTIGVMGGSGEPINFSRAVSGTSDNTSMTTTYATYNTTTKVSYSSTFTGTFVAATGHMKGDYRLTTTEPGVDAQEGSFDLTSYDCLYQGNWTGTWDFSWLGSGSGSLNLVIAKDGSINGTKDGSNVVCGIVTKDNSSVDVFTMNPYNSSNGAIDLTVFIATSINKPSSGELTGIWTCLDDVGGASGTGGFTLQQ